MYFARACRVGKCTFKLQTLGIKTRSIIRPLQLKSVQEGLLNLSFLEQVIYFSDSYIL
mgnify:CR=1 FL=1